MKTSYERPNVFSMMKFIEASINNKKDSKYIFNKYFNHLFLTTVWNPRAPSSFPPNQEDLNDVTWIAAKNLLSC